jgi:hypothetical protein
MGEKWRRTHQAARSSGWCIADKREEQALAVEEAEGSTLARGSQDTTPCSLRWLSKAHISSLWCCAGRNDIGRILAHVLAVEDVSLIL